MPQDDTDIVIQIPDNLKLNTDQLEQLRDTFETKLVDVIATASGGEPPPVEPINTHVRIVIKEGAGPRETTGGTKEATGGTKGGECKEQ